jgi:hypothetical protein
VSTGSYSWIDELRKSAEQRGKRGSGSVSGPGARNRTSQAPAETSTVFTPCEPQPWHGRYSPIPGNSTRFHLKHVDGVLLPAIIWVQDDEEATCHAIGSPAVRELAEAVARGKGHFGRHGGGSFLVNEFGQVLVPCPDGDGRRVLVGELRGNVFFQNPFDPSKPIDLSGADELECGDPWPWPYLGMKYNLHSRSKIYFYREDEDGGHSEYLPDQDVELIEALRSIRRSGAVRFVVNHHGVVLTKCPPGEKQWRYGQDQAWDAFFAGRIDHSKWFEKES